MVLQVRQAMSLPAGEYRDERNLYLVKTDTNKGKWVFRFSINGQRRKMGLGSWPDTGLKQARNKADKARMLIKQGRDPILERRQNRIQLRYLFENVAKDAFEARQAELKDDGKAGRWFSPLQLHAIPKIGKIPVSLTQMKRGS